MERRETGEVRIERSDSRSKQIANITVSVIHMKGGACIHMKGGACIQMKGGTFIYSGP